MSGLRETIGGLGALASLAIASRFRLRGPYWRWRHETAFGSRPDQLSRRERIGAVLDYGRWVYRMRRMSKGRR